MIPFIEASNMPSDSAAQKMNKRKNKPHSCNAFLLAKLTLVKRKFLFAASEKHLDAPPVCIQGKNLLCRKLCLGRDKNTKCVGLSKGIFRIAQQYDSFIMAIDLPLISVYIVVPFANCHEADIWIVFADTRSKLFGLLSNLVGVDDTISAVCQGAGLLSGYYQKASQVQGF